MLPERLRAVLAWPRLAAGALGLIWFLQMGGGPALNPTNTAWLLQGDWFQHWTGWIFFRNEPWSFPLGSMGRLLEPVGTNIGFTDSNPLLAIPLKLLAPWLPGDLQFIGPWLAFCFAMQGFAGATLTSALTRHPWAQLLGGYLFVLTPVLAARVWHDTLCAHWLILLVFYLGLRRLDDPRAARSSVLGSAALVCFAAAVHPYLAAMCLVLALGVCARVGFEERGRWQLASLGALATAGGMLGVLLVVGTLKTGIGDAPGFGLYSADLLTFFDPAGYSRLVPDVTTRDSQSEAFGFPGLGVLAGLLIAGAVLLVRRPRLAPRVAVLAVPCLAMFAFALGEQVSLGGDTIASARWLFAQVRDLTGPFRTSGRFIWPLYYLLITTAIWGSLQVRRRTRRGRGVAALALVVAVQAADLKIDLAIAEPVRFRQAPVADFAGLPAGVKHLRMVPAQIMGVCGGPFDREYVNRTLFLAARLKLTFNSGYFARVDGPAVRASCRELDEAVARGRLSPDTLFAVAESRLEQFRAAGATCARMDGDWYCASADSPDELRRLLR